MHSGKLTELFPLNVRRCIQFKMPIKIYLLQKHQSLSKHQSSVGKDMSSKRNKLTLYFAAPEEGLRLPSIECKERKMSLYAKEASLGSLEKLLLGVSMASPTPGLGWVSCAVPLLPGKACLRSGIF